MIDRLTIATWNLQGSEGVDVAEVAGRLRALGTETDGLDIVVLQEVHSSQARAVANALGMESRVWAFKHWPIVRGREGLAILTRHQLTAARPVCIQPAMFWSWRRRIILLARIAAPAGEVAIADVHLSPHDLERQRREQGTRVLDELASFSEGAPQLIIGDFNDLPGSTAHLQFSGAGWTDAWIAVHGDTDPTLGATNWTQGPRTGRPPTQRLDYVLVPEGWVAERVVVPGPSARGYDDWAELSDHLPLCVTVRRSAP